MGHNTADNDVMCGRKEAIMQAEKQRHLKYKKQEEERENVRQNLRDKVRGGIISSVYSICVCSTRLRNLKMMKMKKRRMKMTALEQRRKKKMRMILLHVSIYLNFVHLQGVI